MLTAEQIQENKMNYFKLLQKLGVDLTKIAQFLDNVNFWEAPASDKYEGAYPGGLCEYSIELFKQLWKLANAYFPGRYSDADLVKVACFREIYRAEMYELTFKNVKNEATGEWEKMGFYRTKEVRPKYGELYFSSLMVAEDLIDMNIEQKLALRHASAFESFEPDIMDLMKDYPLVALTKMAELAAKYVAK